MSALFEPWKETQSAQIGVNCANRRLVDDGLTFSSSLLSRFELDNCRPDIYRYWSKTWTELYPLFVKVHDSFALNSDGDYTFPAEVSQSAVYLIRNPLDICVSYAHFWGYKSYDRAAEFLCDPSHSLPIHDEDLFGQVHQNIGDWSLNVKSWLHQTQIPVRVIRYEDMRHASLETFCDLMSYLRFSFDRSVIEATLEQCDLTRLQEEETEFGFSPRPYGGGQFFRQGQTGAWRDKLAPRTVHKIVDYHHVLMKRFGYIDASGAPK